MRQLEEAQASNVWAKRTLKCFASFVYLPALLIGCGSEELADTDDSVAVARQALSLPAFGSGCKSDGSCTVAIDVPQGIPETQFVFAASSSYVHLNDRAKVNSISGVTPVAASRGDWARIGVDTTAGHFLSPYKYLQVGNTNPSMGRKLYGDLYSGGSGDSELLGPYLGGAHISIGGKLIEPITDSRQPRFETNVIWSFTWPTDEAASPIKRNEGGKWTISPDASGPKAYADITLNSGQTLVLTEGAYFFNSLTINAGGTLVADTSSGKPVRLAVAGNINLNAPITEKIAGAQEPSRFLFAYLGRATAINANKGFQGVLVAPDAAISLWMTNGVPVRGAAFGKSIEVHQAVNVVSGFDPILLQNPATSPGERLPDNNEIRYVSQLGYLDGRSCEHWPVDLKPASYVTALAADATSDAKNASQKILSELQRVTKTNDPIITAFGSMSELVLTSYTEYSAATRGLERRYVVVDPNTKRGYDISYVRMCRETEDLKKKEVGCSPRSLPVSINGQAVKVDIFGRTTPDDRTGANNEATKSVALVAPTVRIEPTWDTPQLYGRAYTSNRIELDVNLVIAANNIFHSETGSSTVELEVRPYAVATPANWANDLNADSRPGVLAVLAANVKNIKTLATFNGARVSQVTCYAAPGYTGTAGFNTTDLVTSWRVAPSTTDAYVTRTQPELHLAASLFTNASAAYRNKRQAGGFVGFVGSTGTTLRLLAPSMEGVQDYGCPITTSTTSALPETTLRVDSSQAGLQAAQILSNGLLFKGMVNAAEAASSMTADGRPAAQYKDVLAALERLDPDAKATIGIDSATQGQVRGLAAVVDQPNAPISLNALGVTYGDVAKPWLPNNVSSATPRSVNEWLKVWDSVTGTVQKLDETIANKENSDVIGALLDNVVVLAKDLNKFASEQRDAAAQDALGQTEALGTLEGARAALELNQDKFLKDMCGLTEPKLDNNPPTDPKKKCTWDNVDASVAQMAADVIGACAAKNKSGGWLDAINAIAAVCPYVSAGVKAFNGLNDFLKESANGATYLGLLKPKGPEAFAGTLEAMRNNKGWVDLAGKAAKEFEDAKEKFISGADTLGLLSTECKDVGDKATARDALMGMKTALALVNSMAVQSQTLQAVLLSTGSTLQYQITNEGAAGVLAQAAAQAADDTEHWVDSARDVELAGYVAQSCQIAHGAIRTGQAQLIDVTQRLQTSAGWARTSALPTVPRKAIGSSDDTSLPLITSVWDAASIAKWFDTASGSGSLADLIANRFVSMADLACNDGSSQSDNIPAMMMYVRKQIVGKELEQFKKYGHVKLAIGLDDLVNSGKDFANSGYRLSGESWLAMTPPQPTAWGSLSAPYVLGVTYSGCFGSATEPCCLGAGCRGAIATYEPWATRLGTASIPTTSGCSEPSDWAVGTTPLVLPFPETPTTPTQTLDSRTCLHQIQTDAKAVTMDWADVDSAASPYKMIDPVKNQLCSSGTAKDIAFTGLRGEPLFGDWAIGYQENVARGLVKHTIPETIDPTTPPTTDQTWQNSNSGLTGIEIYVVVGVEPLANGVASKYESSNYVNAAWRWWESPRP